MKILIQECLEGKVYVDDELVSSIEKGEVIFVSFTLDDDKTTIDRMIDKLLKLRIFPDSEGKTNLNLENYGGRILAISQFTLYADLSMGNRPSFTKVLSGEKAKELYDYFVTKLKEAKSDSVFGIFKADMKVHLINDGPFTIMLDSKEVLH